MMACSKVLPREEWIELVKEASVGLPHLALILCLVHFHSVSVPVMYQRRDLSSALMSIGEDKADLANCGGPVLEGRVVVSLYNVHLWTKNFAMPYLAVPFRLLMSDELVNRYDVLSIKSLVQIN